MSKYVYFFNEGNANMKELLGGKGANLAEMTRLGIPVPTGFTITTECCNKYYEDGEKLQDNIIKDIYLNLEKLEKISGKKFGSLENPLLVSVRSGARTSMPGMMDTILNLGLNDCSVETLATTTNNPRFAYDSYRRFIQMFSDVVKGIEKTLFENVLTKIKRKNNYVFDIELTENDLKKIVSEFKEIYKSEVGEEFPMDVRKQLIEATAAVFKSWNNQRAIVYRRLNNIPSDWGTAVNIQEMVFGNKGEASGTGVAFSRNPANGDKGIYGEYLMNAQGEDVVAGIRTPMKIEKLKEQNIIIYNQFIKIVKILENHYRDMQDMEFTIEEGKLYFLQTRAGKRTAKAAIKIAVDLVEENKISKEEAILRVDPKQLDSLLYSNFDSKELKGKIAIAKGLPASPGAAVGKVIFSSEEAKKRFENKEKVILVRAETSPEDIEGMVVAEGILTARGGMTSHAAVVARGMGKCSVVGCSDLKVDEFNKIIRVKDKVIKEDDMISIDGSTGLIYLGKINIAESTSDDYLIKFMSFADEIRNLKIFANADTVKDAKEAVNFGAEGIGLCRTEHMFFGKERIKAIREMILASGEIERDKALENLLPMQKKDFVGIYEVLEGKSVTVRLLDPPLHEFLPTEKSEIEELAKNQGITVKEINDVINELKEFNPMMGHRGCRLAVSYPEIAKMQTRAIVEAAIEVSSKNKFKVTPEIMIPLVGDVKELKYVKNIILETARKVMEEKAFAIEIKIGTMIEIPRAALMADEIAKEVDFFSFGTNDLTQMTFGFSRDDSNKFLKNYYEKGIYEEDPFKKLDQNGVGKLIKIAVDNVYSIKKNIKMGICGEQGGDPSSITFCEKIGLDYVSCSPYRIKTARLAAAQAKSLK